MKSIIFMPLAILNLILIFAIEIKTSYKTHFQFACTQYIEKLKLIYNNRNILGWPKIDKKYISSTEFFIRQKWSIASILQLYLGFSLITWIKEIVFSLHHAPFTLHSKQVTQIKRRQIAVINCMLTDKNIIITHLLLLI